MAVTSLRSWLRERIENDTELIPEHKAAALAALDDHRADLLVADGIGDGMEMIGDIPRRG